VALVTNVTSDHLGEFGVSDLPTMARAKCVVGTVVRPAMGRVVLGGDDPLLVELAPTFEARVVLFALSEQSPAVQAHVARGGELLTVRDGSFVRVIGATEDVLGRVDEAPLTFGGVARHNVANALAAAAVAFALGLPQAAIVEALRTFGSHPEDNPGRGQVVPTHHGARVLLDFGHNPAGLRELFHLARSLVGPSGRLVTVQTQPGDRTEEDTKAVALEIALASPRAVVLWESEEYRRGREPGEIAGALRRTLMAAGFDGAAIWDAYSETDAIGRALAVATPADVVVVAPHIDRAGVSAMLAGH
jgi:cyanophycin synthetase